MILTHSVYYSSVKRSHVTAHNGRVIKHCCFALPMSCACAYINSTKLPRVQSLWFPIASTDHLYEFWSTFLFSHYFILDFSLLSSTVHYCRGCYRKLCCNSNCSCKRSRSQSTGPKCAIIYELIGIPGAIPCFKLGSIVVPRNGSTICSLPSKSRRYPQATSRIAIPFLDQ